MVGKPIDAMYKYRGIYYKTGSHYALYWNGRGWKSSASVTNVSLKENGEPV